MLTHKGKCLQQREQILQKVSGFLIYTAFLFVSYKRGSSMLLHCVLELACKSVKRVGTCFSSSEG